MANDENLRRGKLPGPGEREPGKDSHGRDLIPQSHGGALAQSGFDWRRTSAEEEDEIRRQVLADPDASLEAIHASLTIATKRLIDRHLGKGGEPPKVVVDTLKEFRQSQVAINEARKARGAAAESEFFFAGVQARLSPIAAVLEEAARPIVEVAS